MHREWKEGDRVQVISSFTIGACTLASAIDDTFAKGEWGTISEIVDGTAFILMDTHHPCLDGYSNELWLDPRYLLEWGPHLEWVGAGEPAASRVWHTPSLCATCGT